MIGKLDKLLGGVILLGGGGAALAAVSGPVLAPLAMFAAVWGWTEQKNEALGLVRAAINALSGKLAGTAGYERRQLIAAAHTTIVVTAFFESFREYVGKESYELLQITDEEKETLIAGRSRHPGESIFEVLYAAEIPAPSPSLGFEENVSEVDRWAANFALALDEFLTGLSAGESLRINWVAVRDGAVERYRSHFLSLAAEVPEFMIWALLGENAATRSVIGKLHGDMARALDGSREALARVESILVLGSAGTVVADGMDLRAAVARANREFSNNRSSRRMLSATDRILNSRRLAAPTSTPATEWRRPPKIRGRRMRGGGKSGHRMTTSTSCSLVTSPRPIRRGFPCCCLAIRVLVSPC